MALRGSGWEYYEYYRFMFVAEYLKGWVIGSLFVGLLARRVGRKPVEQPAIGPNGKLQQPEGGRPEANELGIEFLAGDLGPAPTNKDGRLAVLPLRREAAQAPPPTQVSTFSGVQTSRPV